MELFDTELFSTMRTEAVTMDPQQRLLLHAAYAALSCTSAGGPAAAFGRTVGAYVGIAGAGGSRYSSQCPQRLERKSCFLLQQSHTGAFELTALLCPFLQPRTTRA